MAHMLCHTGAIFRQAQGLDRADPLAEQAVYIGQIRLRSKRSTFGASGLPLEQAVSFRTPEAYAT
jgi:hypothetical protein